MKPSRISRHFLAIPLFALLAAFAGSPVSAQNGTCSEFDFPRISSSTGAISFFSCETGEIGEYDVNGKTVTPLKRNKSLGGFVHKFVWSPDGNRALVLSENVQAAVQQLLFQTDDREPDSLNWWLYDVRNDSATLLDKNIVDIGWLPDGRVVYDWGNQKLSVSKYDSFGDFVKLSDLTSSGRKIDDSLTVVTSSAYAVFPMKNGLYGIPTDGSKSTFFPVEGEVLQVSPNPFDANAFVIRSTQGLYIFDAVAGNVAKVESSLIARDVIYYDKTGLAMLTNGGQVYRHDTATGEDTVILKSPDRIDRIFPLDQDGAFLYTSGKNIFKQSGITAPVGLPTLAATETAQMEQAPVKAPNGDPAFAQIGGIPGLIGVVVVSVLLIAVVMIILRRRRG